VTFASYAEALEWVRPRWGDVQVPYRLHDRALGDDGAPRLNGVVLRYLDAQANDTDDVTVTANCYHWRLPPGDRLMGCPDCAGMGTYDKHVTRYRYPMRAALARLDGERARAPLQPRPIAVVLTLARSFWRLELAADALGQATDTMEALAVMSLRLLYGKFAEAPVPTRGWVSGRSQSQRDAESAIA
jgi:hypothetical protein